MTADLAAGFLERALPSTGTIQLKQDRPGTFPDLFVSHAPDAYVKAGAWAYGRADVHYTLCSYSEFNYDRKLKFKRDPEYHTPNPTWFVVIDADDKDNDNKISKLSGQEIYESLTFKPDLIVRSGGGGFHAYWFSDFPMAPIERAQFRRYLGETVSERYVIDARAGLYGHDTIRMPYTLHPNGNWCYVEVDAGTRVLTKDLLQELPPPRHLLEFFPGAKLLDYGMDYPRIEFELPVEKFSNVELRQCNVYQSIQDAAHTHSGHAIDLFYLSWVNCVAEAPDTLLQKYVLTSMAACNSPDHYERQWESLKDRSGNRCKNLDYNPARGMCTGCPVNGTADSSPATLIRLLRERQPETPDKAPEQTAVASQVVVPPVPVMDLTPLPTGYTREDDSIVYYDAKSVRKVLCADFELRERTVVDGERYVVIRSGGRVRVFKHAQTLPEFTRIVENSLGEFFAPPQAVFPLYQRWARKLPDKGSIVKRLGWQDRDHFATDKVVITSSGDLLPTVIPDMGPMPEHQKYMDNFAGVAAEFWRRLFPIWCVEDCWAHRLTLLTLMGSSCQKFCSTPGNIWISFRGETGAGKTTLLDVARSVSDAKIPGATTLAALENSFYQQGDCGSYMDEFVVKDDSGIQMLLSVLRGVTTNRSAKAGTVNQPLREWQGISVLCSNEGLHSRLVQTDYNTMMATLARVIEVKMVRSTNPEIPTLLEQYKDFARANASYNGCLGLSFSHWVATHVEDARAIVKHFESHFKNTAPEARFRSKWKVLVLTAHEILSRMGWDLGGINAGDVLDDAARMSGEHEATIRELKFTNPILTIDALLRSPALFLVSVNNALGPYSVPGGKRLAFQAAGYYYLPIESIASVKARMGTTRFPDPNSYLKDNEIADLARLWEAIDAEVILPGPYSDHKYRCLIVPAPEGIDSREPQLIEQHYGELVGAPSQQV